MFKCRNVNEKIITQQKTPAYKRKTDPEFEG